MSTPVALEALAEHVAARGPTAYLVTVRPNGHPHVVAVTVGEEGDRLVVGAGHTTSANVEAHPDVTLIWPAPPGGDGYSLLVDGRARPVPSSEPATLAIEADRAVLHRTPEANPAAPSCVTVLPAP